MSRCLLSSQRMSKKGAYLGEEKKRGNKLPFYNHLPNPFCPKHSWHPRKRGIAYVHFILPLSQESFLGRETNRGPFSSSVYLKPQIRAYRPRTRQKVKPWGLNLPQVDHIQRAITVCSHWLHILPKKLVFLCFLSLINKRT